MRLDTVGSMLTSHIDPDTTNLYVTTMHGPCWVDSVRHPSEFPFHIAVGNEVMAVTAISGSSSPQTFTVTRSTGDARPHGSGAHVRLAQPVTAVIPRWRHQPTAT